jgi:hypothetical protein
MDNGLPIVVFDVGMPDGIVRAVRGEGIGTQVGTTETVLAQA